MPYPEQVKDDVVESADVCVIGSGAAGAIIASELARADMKVVLLEKGGYYYTEDMNQREVDMMSMLWKNA
ncbi:MAG: FAD-dependent oxidoreductase, partial [Nitrososphaera sp.]